MKKVEIVILVIVMIIVIGGIALYIILPTKPAGTETAQVTPITFPDSATTSNIQSPADFTTEFYTWYLASIEKDPSFPSLALVSTSFGQWLTPEFIQNWQSIGNSTDADPVLLAQDDPNTWGAGIRSIITAQSPTASTVSVTIGTGTTAHSYVVKLLIYNGSWKIDSVSLAS
jgi:hypothetical protein